MTSSKPSTSPKQLPDAQADQPDTRILNLMQYKKKRTIFNTSFSKTAKRGKKLQGTRNRVIFSAFILISCTQRCYNKSHFLGSINICEALGWNLISGLFLLNVSIVLFQTRGIKKVLKYWIDFLQPYSEANCTVDILCWFDTSSNPFNITLACHPLLKLKSELCRFNLMVRAFRHRRWQRGSVWNNLN